MNGLHMAGSGPIRRPVVRVDPDLADLIAPYLSHRWADLAMAHKLLLTGELERIVLIGRRIHGSAASYGFDQLGEIARQLEDAAMAADTGAVQSALVEFGTFLRTVHIEYC